jgi:hypothetical protein
LLQQIKDAGLLGSQPQGTRQAEVAHGGGQGHRSGAVADQSGDLFRGAEVALMNDAGLTVDAGALDDVVVELVAFLFRDEAGHIG